MAPLADPKLNDVDIDAKLNDVVTDSKQNDVDPNLNDVLETDSKPNDGDTDPKPDDFDTAPPEMIALGAVLDHLCKGGNVIQSGAVYQREARRAVQDRTFCFPSYLGGECSYFDEDQTYATFEESVAGTGNLDEFQMYSMMNQGEASIGATTSKQAAVGNSHGCAYDILDVVGNISDGIQQCECGRTNNINDEGMAGGVREHGDINNNAQTMIRVVTFDMDGGETDDGTSMNDLTDDGTSLNDLTDDGISLNDLEKVMHDLKEQNASTPDGWVDTARDDMGSMVPILAVVNGSPTPIQDGGNSLTGGTTASSLPPLLRKTIVSNSNETSINGYNQLPPRQKRPVSVTFANGGNLKSPGDVSPSAPTVPSSSIRARTPPRPSLARMLMGGRRSRDGNEDGIVDDKTGTANVKTVKTLKTQIVITPATQPHKRRGSLFRDTVGTIGILDIGMRMATSCTAPVRNCHSSHGDTTDDSSSGMDVFMNQDLDSDIDQVNHDEGVMDGFEVQRFDVTRIEI